MRLRERKQVNYDFDESEEEEECLPQKKNFGNAVVKPKDPLEADTSSLHEDNSSGNDGADESGSEELPSPRSVFNKQKEDDADSDYGDADDIETDDEPRDARSGHYRSQGTSQSRNTLPREHQFSPLLALQSRATRARVNYNQESLFEDSSKEADSRFTNVVQSSHVSSPLCHSTGGATKGCGGEVVQGSFVSSDFIIEDDLKMEDDFLEVRSVEARPMHRRRLIKLADRCKTSSKIDSAKNMHIPVKLEDEKTCFNGPLDHGRARYPQHGVSKVGNCSKHQDSTSSGSISESSGEMNSDSKMDPDFKYMAQVYIRKRRSPEGAPKERPKPKGAAKKRPKPDVISSEGVVLPELKVDVFGLFTEGDDSRPIVKRVGLIEKILSVRNKGMDSALYCVKLNGKGYRNVVYVRESVLTRAYSNLLRHFSRRMDELGRSDGNLAEKEDSPAFNPAYVEIDRIIASEQRGPKRFFLVKWQALPYSESTWESAESLLRDKAALKRYLQISTKGAPGSNTMAFKDGRTLRDYQKKGLAWMDHNYHNQVNCILADEMGLGKTIQSVSMLQNLRVKWKIKGPFLVVAPVSTLGHWQREIESLTDMNCLVYSGSTEDRNVVKEYEFYTDSKSADLKFNVLLTGYEVLMKDHHFLSKQEWQYIIVDEAHRLKTKQSKTSRTLKEMSVRKGGLLLLTGTPVQNNTKEIFSLLNILDSDKFKSEEEFLSKYGDIRNAEQVRDLQENILKPRLLRRMKEDVEKSIPLKEETIIWVELTKDQRSYYRAIYENRIADLLKGSQNNNIPNLRNVAMELRKLCNHPFLCDGLEEHLASKYTRPGQQRHEGSCEAVCQSSGKMLLLNKLLPMLKDAGRRVLIFSQFTIMLDLLEDFLHLKDYSYERIDGKIRGSERQAAIDRYSARGSETFVFLLSTRAGGLGITLTAADTCVIYDSDWNPQNDLQAMARCHRIGQTKDVKIYRLITRNTYEQHLFECSSRKYGLDEAILGNFLGSNMDIEHTKNIEALLKRGAYDILKEDGEAEAAAFHAQNIDQILEQRTQQRLIGGRGNNTFSVATFICNPEAQSEEIDEAEKVTVANTDSPQFWQELLPEAYQASLLVPGKPQVMISTGPRRRAQVNYKEKREHSDDEGSSEEEAESEGRRRHSAIKREKDLIVEETSNHWTEKELKRLESRLIMLGKGREEQIMVEAELEHRGLSEVQQVADTLIQLFQFFEEDQRKGNLAKKAESKSKDQDVTIKDGSVINQPQDSTAASDIFSQYAHDSKWPIIPSLMQKALNSPYCLLRIQKNACRYLQALHDRDVLSKALSDPDYSLASLSRSKKLPQWWGDVEDLHFMKGALKHGHKEFTKIREDPDLCFFARLNAQTSQSLTDASQSGGAPEDDWPHDSVLMMRLKKIVESLPNGLSEREIKRRAAIAEAARKRWLAKQSQDMSGTPNLASENPQRGFIVYVDGIRYEQFESKARVDNGTGVVTCCKQEDTKEIQWCEVSPPSTNVGSALQQPSKAANTNQAGVGSTHMQRAPDAVALEPFEDDKRVSGSPKQRADPLHPDLIKRQRV